MIIRSGDHLLARLGKQDEYRIYASAPNDFYYRVVDAQLHFIKAADGHASALVLHQGGRTIVYAAPGHAVPADESRYPPIVPLERAALREYVGDYAGAYGTFYVTLDDDRLMVRLESQQAFPTYPSAKDRFFYKVVQARIDFRRDAAGKVSGLTLHQSGHDVSAARK